MEDDTSMNGDNLGVIESDVNSPGSSDEGYQPTDWNIWDAITNWFIKSDADALDGFRYWFKFCNQLENDPTIVKIMETLHALRDEDESLDFKEALHLALMKRKYLIYETLKAFKAEGIWKILLQEPDNGLDVFQLLTKYILACKSMQHDSIFMSVKEMIEDLKSDVDPMNFEEALNHSIEAKADDIFTAVGELSIDRSNPSHIWERISKNFNPSNPYFEVEYFINMEKLIKVDPTFQTVLTDIGEYLKDGKSLDVALYNAVKENESMIHDSFSSGGDLWNAMLTDEFGDKKEELDVFKTYVLYYMGLQQDELFQNILEYIRKLEEDGWEYKAALNHAMQSSKVDIRNMVGHPFIPGLRYMINLPPPL